MESKKAPKGKARKGKGSGETDALKVQREAALEGYRALLIVCEDELARLVGERWPRDRLRAELAKWDDFKEEARAASELLVAMRRVIAYAERRPDSELAELRGTLEPLLAGRFGVVLEGAAMPPPRRRDPRAAMVRALDSTAELGGFLNTGRAATTRELALVSIVCGCVRPPDNLDLSTPKLRENAIRREEATMRRTRGRYGIPRGVRLARQLARMAELPGERLARWLRGPEFPSLEIVIDESGVSSRKRSG